MSQLSVTYKKLSEIRPYEKNPRKNDDAVEKVAASIQQFGFKVPIVIDADGVIVAGHTRYKAASQLGMKEVPCVVADDLTPEQIKAFRVADNKVSEFSMWDYDLLGEELSELKELGVDMEEFGFDEDIKEAVTGEPAENPYTRKIDIPQYQVTGDNPSLDALMNRAKTDELLEKIDNSGVSDEEKEFLRCAAMRHLVFDYRNIAEYYAHATPEMQELMEESALVIIDYDDAIRLGYVKLGGIINEMVDEITAAEE